MSTNFLGSPLLLHRRRTLLPPSKPSSSAAPMAACVHSSGTKPPPQKTTPNIRFDDYPAFCLPDFEKIPKFPNPNFDLWPRLKDEARSDAELEPILSKFYSNSILRHESMESALADHLSVKLAESSLSSLTLRDLFAGVLAADPGIISSAAADLIAAKERDPACISYVHCFLNFKGFMACQSHRIAHNLWSSGRKTLALLIQSRVSEVFAVDIHPGARIGRGILLDHATGLVVGETSVIGDDVSILHNVTLGGTGKSSGDRHPKIGNGVLIGAGTCVLGNVRVEDGAKIGAGSVVLKGVPARTTAVGNPARLIGGKENPMRMDDTPSLTMDHTAHISEWSDYVI